MTRIQRSREILDYFRDNYYESPKLLAILFAICKIDIETYKMMSTIIDPEPIVFRLAQLTREKETAMAKHPERN